MRAAVTIPDEVFARAEGLARQLKMSRSELYSRALEELLSRHAMDAQLRADDARPSADILQQATRRILEDTE